MRDVITDVPPYSYRCYFFLPAGAPALFPDEKVDAAAGALTLVCFGFLASRLLRICPLAIFFSPC